MVKKVLIDLDGVLHRANKGFADGTLYDKPMPKARYSVEKLIEKGWEVVVFTARTQDQWPAVYEWLDKYNFPKMRITNIKEPARFYIDNRAVRFTNWEDVIYYLI